jgi:putative transposase
MLERLREMIRQVCRKMDCELIEFSGESDHVHILLDFHPKNSISAVAGCLKSSTARVMKKEFPEQVNKFYRDKISFWSNSYYVASSGGAPIEKLKEYIKNQDTPTS